MKPEHFYVEMGRRICLRREELGMTQEKLGRSLKRALSRAAISNIEKGRQRVLTHVLVEMASALGIQSVELTGEVALPEVDAAREQTVKSMRRLAALETLASVADKLRSALANESL